MRIWKEKNPKAEENLISEMIAAVGLLFPHRTREELLKGMKKVIKKALEFKEHISEENALYYCYWESGGKDFFPQRMHPSGEQIQGKVAFCTFPGLIRIQLKLDEKVSNLVVKAHVLLQTDVR